MNRTTNIGCEEISNISEGLLDHATNLRERLPITKRTKGAAYMTNAIRIAFLALGFASTNAAAGEIGLTMSGFSKDEGMARIVLVEGEEGYAGVTPATLVASVPIKDGQAVWTGEVPPGTYAIIGHHDENENDELDRPVFELPLEPYGYSNGAWTNFGLPSFEEVAFEVGEGVDKFLLLSFSTSLAT